VSVGGAQALGAVGGDQLVEVRVGIHAALPSLDANYLYVERKSYDMKYLDVKRNCDHTAPDA
jgi:hypothetical protein